MLGGTVLLLAISVVGGADNKDKREAYRAAVVSAKRDAERVVALAGGRGGIPPQGAVWLLRNDPATQGPKLFARNCASCHRYDGHDGYIRYGQHGNDDHGSVRTVGCEHDRDRREGREEGNEEDEQEEGERPDWRLQSKLRRLRQPVLGHSCRKRLLERYVV